jgi:hypothetical protein
MADTKISLLDPITAPQDPAKMFVPLFAQDGTPLNARMNFAEMFKTPKQLTLNASSAGSSVIFTTPADGRLLLTDNAGTSFGRLQLGGTTASFPSLKRNATGIDFRLADDSGYAPITAAAIILSSDVILDRDSADVLALRRTTNAQQFCVYNTYTSSTNYERGVFDWKTTANILRIGTEKGSIGGTARAVSIVTDGVERIGIDTSGTSTFSSSTFPVVDIRRSTGITTGLVTSLKLSSVTSSDMADGFGTAFVFAIRDNAGIDNVIADVSAMRDGADGTGAFVIRPYSSGSPTERFRVTASGVSTFTGQTVITGGTIASSSKPVIDATQTWNDAAVNFTGFKQNITLTAANTNSLLFDWQVGGTSYLKLTQFGDLVGSAFTGSDFSVRLQNGSLKLGSASIVSWGSGNAAGSMDSGLARVASGIVKFTNASTGAGMIQLQEAGAAPSAPAADNVIIYAIDNGSGKTQLMALFSSGAAQQIAIQP